MRRLWHHEDGASSVEYALIASLIAVAVVGALQVLGPEVLFGLYNKVHDTMASAGM